MLSIRGTRVITMARLAPELDKEALQRVVDQIATRFQPCKVILFGSYAYGIPNEDSDVDLLVVMETEANPLRAAADISAAVEHPFPLDILVMDPQQFQASIERGGVFATEIALRGRVLYEA